ncbi:TIR domain-containing protein [Tolypothrix sp. FACHB-123]|uniref:TIR domain-containing protein n=1 Tax=Tolypothrix sp. FACHB-123 TaxID=2692868 RepID=UPI0016865970|nr:TIR domain-containing protein [Tolypothrix sp. FACHB-123]MBD2358870.1 TIR domain-containing protein [Tolypothrix sp. FACHB-123]
MKVFISYSWQDVPLRRAIVGEIKKINGIEVLFDSAQINPSSQIHPTISKLLDSCDVVVAVLTPSSLASTEVLDELSRANERNKRILPLLDESVSSEQIPYYLRDTLRIGFLNSTFDKALDTLVASLESLLRDNSSTSVQVTSKLKSNFAPSTVREFGDLDIVWLQRSNLGRELLEQVVTMCTIFPFSWKIGAQQYTTPVFVAPNTFIPDDWTRNFLRGVISSNTAREAKTIVEIGVGTGIVPIALSLVGFQFNKYYGFDLDTLATRVASINVAFYQLTDKVALSGGGSIFEPERNFELGTSYADLVIANVPQVPSMSTGPIRDLFDYYHMPVGLGNREQYSAMQGLWLVELILKQARSRLHRDGHILLNIGGRPGDSHIITMIEECGYRANIIHTEIVEQDPETDISALVHFERTQNIEYEFYRDINAIAKISARTAYDRISEGQKCYHKLHIIEARPLS